MRNNEPLHPLQQCLRDNGEQIAEKVTELQFKEVLAVNAELRAEVEKLKQDSRNYLHEVEQLKAQRDELTKLLNELLHQIDINDFMDSNGHTAKMLRAVHDGMEALSRIEVKL